MTENELTKPELLKILKITKVPVDEGAPADKNVEVPVRIHFWDYLWEDITASGQKYNTKVTYQISVIADKPRCEELLRLKKELNKIGLFPIIQHEYNQEDRRWHSFFSLEVLENV